MAAPQHVQERIARALKKAQKVGCTTKKEIVTAAMATLGKGNDYGLPRADLMMAARAIYSAETDRQLKRGLPDNVIHVAFRNAPPELAQVMRKLPAWIATSEGGDARWVPSLQATVEDWQANFQLKLRVANRTRAKARTSKNVADYLARYGLSSLSEAMSTTAEAAE